MSGKINSYLWMNKKKEKNKKTINGNIKTFAKNK